MKRLLASLVMTCAISVSILAGEVPTVGNSLTDEIPSVDGNIPTVGSSLSGSAVDLIQTFISLLSV